MDKIKNKSKTYKKARGGSFFTPMRKPDTRPLQAQTLPPEAQIGPGKMPLPPEMVKPNTLPPQAQTSPVIGGRRLFGVEGPLPQATDPVRPMGVGRPLPLGLEGRPPPLGAAPMPQSIPMSSPIGLKKGGRVGSSPRGVGAALRGFGKAMKGSK